MSEPETAAKGDVGGGTRALTLTRREINAITTNATRGALIKPAERQASIDMLNAIIADLKVPRRTRITASRALAALEAIELRDLHHTERLQHEAGILDLRMKRAEQGLPNDSVALVPAPVRELPLPTSLLEYRKKILEPGQN